uniref:Fibronectin type-III domain-containing protein n=1 Tax=Oryzias sinensis TaxID=183150 RepID=A0A8C7YGV1_9TELE
MYKLLPDCNLSNLHDGCCTVKEGSTTRINIPVSGIPYPSVIWKKGDMVLGDTGRMCVEASPGVTTLLLRDCQRADADTFTIVAKNSAGLKECKFQLKVVGKPGICTGPIKFSEITADGITLEWGPPTDDGGAEVSNYIVEKRRTTDNKWIKRTDGGQYSVTGKNLLGTVTETITVLVHDIPGPPIGPIKLEEVSCDHVIMSWEPPENDGGVPINNYIVEMRETTGTSWVELAATVIRTTFKAVRLTTGTQYQFRVKAQNRYGIGPCIISEPVFAAYPFDVPGQPGSPVVTSFNRDSMVLSWNEPSSDGGSPILGYHLEDTAKLEIKTSDFHTTLTNKDSLRRDGGAFTLTASNPGGFAKFTFNVKVLDRPGPPDSLTVTDIAAEKCVLNWIHPAHDGGAKIEYFIIQRRETSRLAWTNVATDLQANRFKVTKLLKGNEYIFRVMAVNKYGVGEPVESVPVICTNPYVPSDPPSQPEVTTITKDSMVVCWERPEHDGGSRINTYIIERRDKTGLRWVKCNKRTVTDLRYKVSGLTLGHEYEFRIFAENNAGLSQPSLSSPFYKAVDTIFQPGPPGNPRVLDTTNVLIETFFWLLRKLAGKMLAHTPLN